MATRIRGKEATIQVIVDGELLDGSFAKIENFTLTPRTDLVETDFVGESVADLDYMHHGFDFSFGTHHKDSKLFDVLQSFTSADEAGLEHPQVNIVVSVNYRALSEADQTFVLGECVMKMGDYSIGSRTDYITSSWEGKCKTYQPI